MVWFHVDTITQYSEEESESEVVFWFDVGHVCDHSPLPDSTISLARRWSGASQRPLHGKREPRGLVAVQVLDCVEEPTILPLYGKVDRE